VFTAFLSPSDAAAASGSGGAALAAAQASGAEAGSPSAAVATALPKAECTYRLRAVAMHHGSNCSSGHYTSLTRLHGDSDKWVVFDDLTVREVASALPRSLELARSAYLLLYERRLATTTC